MGSAQAARAVGWKLETKLRSTSLAPAGRPWRGRRRSPPPGVRVWRVELGPDTGREHHGGRQWRKRRQSCVDGQSPHMPVFSTPRSKANASSIPDLGRAGTPLDQGADNLRACRVPACG